MFFLSVRIFSYLINRKKRKCSFYWILQNRKKAEMYWSFAFVWRNQWNTLPRDSLEKNKIKHHVPFVCCWINYCLLQPQGGAMQPLLSPHQTDLFSDSRAQRFIQKAQVRVSLNWPVKTISGPHVLLNHLPVLDSIQIWSWPIWKEIIWRFIRDFFKTQWKSIFLLLLNRLSMSVQ